jgi:hypothetical protein
MRLSVDQRRGVITLTLTRENLAALDLLLDRASDLPAAATATDGDYTLLIIPVEDHHDPEPVLTIPAAWE